MTSQIILDSSLSSVLMLGGQFASLGYHYGKGSTAMTLEAAVGLVRLGRGEVGLRRLDGGLVKAEAVAAPTPVAASSSKESLDASS